MFKPDIMRTYSFTLAVLLLLSACAGQESNKDEGTKDDLLSTDLVKNPHTASGTDSVAMGELPTMDFADTVHDFGSLHDGEKGVYEFEFTNNGKKPLIISSATGSCGCTVPHYPRDPIAPGKTGVINVQFDSKDKMGHVEKSVTISTNSQRGIHMLYIKADVITDKK